MSTHANVQITDEQGLCILYFKHGDGQPERVLPDLREFLTWVADGRIRDSAEQAAGWFLLLGVRNYRNWLDEQVAFYRDSGLPINLGPLPIDPYDPPLGVAGRDARRGYGWKPGFYLPATKLAVDAAYRYTVDVAALTVNVLDNASGPPSALWRLNDAGRLVADGGESDAEPDAAEPGPAAVAAPVPAFPEVAAATDGQ